ncbi:hypothetical protein CPB83DRAFT_756947 [Crepidotus variabilis]|uniref:Peptidase M48 domain-containing protein n=1 Tax=Crepidotus variabilis TaxID=179855 RepID=A0A9P6EPV4_9AGAR|nr:hypothetical protein CPB83DRAFT_756947 [Crepidotus variabilis]
MASRIIIRGLPYHNSPLQQRRTLSVCAGFQFAASTSNFGSDGFGLRRLTRVHSPAIPPRPSLQPPRPLHISVRHFHATSRRQGLPALIPFLASIFKASVGLEIARTAGRIALTFIPIFWLGGLRSKRAIQYAAVHGIPVSDEKREAHIRTLRRSILALKILVAIPFTLFWATIIGSLERTPLTGRWRTILLSPDEEDEIAAQLAGQGWYTAVAEILKGDGSPRIIPPSDWRYQWVQSTLRRLENTVPVLSSEPELCPNWTEGGPNDCPLPPPAQHPLRPRPRATEYLRWMCDKMAQKADNPLGPYGPIPGPPYSLVLVEKPDASNAFSYGFGPNGGSGIVVYTGFLDDIVAKHSLPNSTSELTQPARSYWSWLFGGLFSSPPTPSHPIPSEEQTTELAVLLAHEMAHLVLSHHLESLSSVEVMVPGALSIIADVIRVLIFPITAIFGPFVNDAVAQLGKVGSGELAKISEYCNSVHQEIEADVVSARILAHAGFDARSAVSFWEGRGESECAIRMGNSKDDGGRHLESNMSGPLHPMGETRLKCLRDELQRWECERRNALTKRAKHSTS